MLLYVRSSVWSFLRNSFTALQEYRWSVALLFFTYLLELVSIVARIIIVAVIGFYLTIIAFIVAVFISIFRFDYIEALDRPTFTLAASFAIFSSYTLLSVLAIFFVIGPPILSIVCLFVWRVGGNFFTRFALGARSMTERENRQYRLIRDHVMQRAPAGTVAPEYVYVVPSQPADLNAFTIGETIYLSSGLLKSDFLAPLLAREIGNLNNGNGRLIRALRYLVLFPVYLFPGAAGHVASATDVPRPRVQNAQTCLVNSLTSLFSLLLSLTVGGFGLFLLSPFWAYYWRNRVFEADAFAFACGQGNQLIEYLETFSFLDVATPFFLSSLPYRDERKDRLEELRDIGGVLPQQLRPTTRIMLRGAGVVASLLLFFILYPYTVGRVVNRVAIAISPSPEGVWQLTRFTYDSNSQPYQLASQQGITTTLVLNDGRAVLHAGQSNTTPGTYTTTGFGRVQFNVNSQSLFLGDQVYRIEKSGENMVLQGNDAGFMFALLNNEEIAALTPTATPTLIPVAQLQQAIIGRWVSVQNDFDLQFEPNGSVTYAEYGTGTYQFVEPDRVQITIPGILNNTWYVELRGSTLTIKGSKTDSQGLQLQSATPRPTATPTHTSTPTTTATPTRTALSTPATTPTNKPVVPPSPVSAPTPAALDLLQRMLGSWQRQDGRLIEIRSDGTFISEGESYTYIYSQWDTNRLRIEVTGPNFSQISLVQMPDGNTLLFTNPDGSNLRVYSRVGASREGISDWIVGRFFTSVDNTYIEIRSNGEYVTEDDTYSWSLQVLNANQGVLTVTNPSKHFIYNVQMLNEDIFIFEGYGHRYEYRRVQ